MSDEIDYATVDVPEDESPENYHYTARRADLLQRVQEAGHPSAINQSQLARDVYQCAQCSFKFVLASSCYLGASLQE